MSFNLEDIVSLDEASNTMIHNDDCRKETRLEKEDFRTDQSVPPGWSYKGVIASRKNFSLKCPLGNIYRSRADALTKMYSSGKYSKEEIQMIKDCLKYKGWEENENIPKGWRIKRVGHYSVFYLEQGGKKFKSAVKAFKFVKKYNKYYSEEDLEKLQIMTNGLRTSKIPSSSSFAKVNRARKSVSTVDSSWLPDASLYPEGWSSEIMRLKQFQAPAITNLKAIMKQNRYKKPKISDSSWLSDASLYPEGWKYKMCKNSTSMENKTNIKFLLPDGKELYGLRLALAYMIRNSFSTEDISIMRKALGQRGWKEDPSLPENWLFRWMGRLHFCDSFGNFKFALGSNSLNEENILKIKNFQRF